MSRKYVTIRVEYPTVHEVLEYGKLVFESDTYEEYIWRGRRWKVLVGKDTPVLIWNECEYEA